MAVNCFAPTSLFIDLGENQKREVAKDYCETLDQKRVPLIGSHNVRIVSVPKLNHLLKVIVHKI